ncbi:MAG: hypothetical protein E6K24_12470 [Gammaproteobacteria bacterium]|nr:MAG: hypothetical protein E6K24_12470 [Gammaproteobacteria bacterium]
MTAAPAVLLLNATDRLALALLLARYGMRLTLVAPGEGIPGSYWGHSEAGLKADRLYARLDTPVHSVLHEASHYVCMTPERRAGLDRDAGGDDLEESAVCYLQLLLADQLPGIGRARMFSDMDQWGYSFRLGGSHAWFAEDADDVRQWLRDHGVIDADDRPTGAVRSLPALTSSP